MIMMVKLFFEKSKLIMQIFALSLVLTWTGLFVQNDIYTDVTFFLFLIFFFLVMIILIYQIINNNRPAILMALLCILLGILSFFFLSIAYYIQSITMGDHYADDLIIPQNIEVYKPAGGELGERTDSIIRLKKTNQDFVLYKAGQSGHYNYDIWVGTIDSGTVYLKAYEVTKNDRLSEQSLTKNSQIRIGNPSPEIKRFEMNGYFTIYEGDWEVPYAARFEVWFRPDSGNERLLFEKNYIISGWQH
jgi:hypothetical protein